MTAKNAVSGPEITGGSPTPTLALIGALDRAVAAVTANHEGLAGIPIVLVVGASKPKVHGHFAAGSWRSLEGQETAEQSTAHEILLSGESLSRGAVATFGTLVHELVHAYANANGIADTSNRGRYHNKRFKVIAEEFGLTIEQAQTIGHSVTTVPAETQAAYADVIADIGAALTHYRAGGSVGAPKVKKPVQKYVLTCGCEDVALPVSKKFVDLQHSVVCAVCDTLMVAEAL